MANWFQILMLFVEFHYDVQDSFKQCVFTKQNVHISLAEMYLKSIIPFIQIQY